MGLLDKFKEQEVVDFRLVITLLVIGVIGIGVWVWVGSGGGEGQDIANTEHTYHCHFDDATREVTNADFYKLRASPEKDAIMNDRASGCPQRVRCPECNRMSCFKLDSETGEEIEVDEAWDLSEDAVEAGRGTPRSN